jgi:hypothetical protein
LPWNGFVASFIAILIPIVNVKTKDLNRYALQEVQEIAVLGQSFAHLRRSEFRRTASAKASSYG